jgi:hypothetical protein
METLHLKLSAPYFYPTNQAANRENKLQPKATEGPGLLDYSQPLNTIRIQQ